MLINEIAVGTILTPNLEIVVDDHALDRAKERGVDPRAVDYIIRKQMPKILKKLERIEVNQRFWVYDWSRETALGMKRLSSTQMKFMLRTVLPKAPGITPGIEKIISIS